MGFFPRQRIGVVQREEESRRVKTRKPAQQNGRVRPRSIDARIYGERASQRYGEPRLELSLKSKEEPFADGPNGTAEERAGSLERRRIQARR